MTKEEQLETEWVFKVLENLNYEDLLRQDFNQEWKWNKSFGVNIIDKLNEIIDYINKEVNNK